MGQTRERMNLCLDFASRDTVAGPAAHSTFNIVDLRAANTGEKFCSGGRTATCLADADDVGGLAYLLVSVRKFIDWNVNGLRRVVRIVFRTGAHIE